MRSILQKLIYKVRQVILYMAWILHFFRDIYDIYVLLFFLVSAYILLFIDWRSFRKKGLKKEARLSRIAGYVYAALGIGLYITSLIIKD